MTTAVKGHFSCPQAVFTTLWEDWRLADELSLSQSYTTSSPGSRTGFSPDQQVVNNNHLPEEKCSWRHPVLERWFYSPWHFFYYYRSIFLRGKYVFYMGLDLWPNAIKLVVYCVVVLPSRSKSVGLISQHLVLTGLTHWLFCKISVCATVRHCGALSHSYPLSVCLPLTSFII